MASMTKGAPASTIERAAALLAKDPARAGREAEALLKADPRDPRAALILASARRRLGDPRAALAILVPLARAFPKAANTQYELGVALADLGDAAAGLAALRQAVSLNRDLPDAWRALGDLLFREGQAAAAEAAFAEHRRAAVLDPALKPAAEALFRGEVTAAEQMLRAHLLAHLTDASATRMLAEVYVRQSRHGDAEVLFARSLELDPDHDGARFGYADALFKQQKATQALAQIEALVAGAPRDPAYLNLLAACLALVGDDDRVIAIFEGLLADYPKQPRLWLNYGHTLRAVGRRDDAVAAYKRCLALAPDLGDAYWSLANLKVASFTEAEEATMRAALAKPDLAVDDRLHLHYALGKALEDRKAFEPSFQHYVEGAALRRATTPYDAEATTAHMRRSKALFSAEFLADRQGQGSTADAPIFILGLPRSGSTLIEQILASHSAVEGTMELPDIGIIARGLGPTYPQALAEL
uniref:tetratricopeptide repeat protein n=1 Tax=Phenylobacterium aquaticum TaxID=1763816 RepID=UPI0026ED7968